MDEILTEEKDGIDPLHHELDWTFLSRGKLFDRQEQQDLLSSAFERRMVSSDMELVLVSGRSGTGKTVLAQSLQAPCTSRGGYFCSGKFDQLQRPEPYAPFVAAFTEFSQLVVERGQVESVKNAITSSLESEVRVLVDMIPALVQILGSESSTSCVKGADAQQQVKLVFCKFVHAISSPQQPLVLFIDDLQWADSGSLDLLSTLLCYNHDCSSGFMILGTCRYNEVTLNHPLAVMLRQVEDDSGVSISNIVVGNLRDGAVSEVVAQVLHTSSERIKPLADMIYEQTHGNIFFVLQFLKTLVEEDILYHSKNDWTWNKSKIDESLDGKDVAFWLARQMERQPPHVQEMLMVAACIGAEFDEYVLHEIILNTSQVIDALSTTVDRGFCSLVDRPNATGCYRFTHDKVQQAAYSLIDPEERNAFHLDIGRLLFENLSAEEIEMNVFLVVNQLSRGIELINDQDELYDIAVLCLRAGEKATLSSDFCTAAGYLDLGIMLLGSRGWRDRYDLSLDLYNAAAEAEYCTANFERMDQHVEQVLLHARSFHDKLRAHTTQVYALGTRQRLQEAIDMGFDVLKRLGEPFPSKPRPVYIVAHMLRTKKLLHGKKDRDLLSLPYMNNPNKVAAMQMLNVIFTYTFIGRADMLPFVAFRMVKLTLKYGLCAISAFGFSSYGLLLCASGDIETGYRYGQLALQILQRFDARQWLPRVYTLVYGLNKHWKIGVRECLDSLIIAHKVGLQTGDIEYSMVGANRYCYEGFSVSLPLPQLEEETRKYSNLMAAYKQELWTTLNCSLWQMLQNFMGLSEDPLVLTGEAFDQEAVLKNSQEASFATSVCCIHTWRHIIAYYFNEYKVAAEMAVGSRNMEVVGRSAFVVCLQYFVDALTSLALAIESKEGRAQNLKQARKCRKKIVPLVKHCPANCSNKLALIDAELCVVQNQTDLALTHYRNSIAMAHDQGFLHEEALASERAGIMFQRIGNERLSREYLLKARACYLKWGADGKVKQMTKLYRGVLND